MLLAILKQVSAIIVGTAAIEDPRLLIFVPFWNRGLLSLTNCCLSWARSSLSWGRHWLRGCSCCGSSLSCMSCTETTSLRLACFAIRMQICASLLRVILGCRSGLLLHIFVLFNINIIEGPCLGFLKELFERRILYSSKNPSGVWEVRNSLSSGLALPRKRDTISPGAGLSMGSGCMIAMSFLTLQ